MLRVYVAGPITSDPVWHATNAAVWFHKLRELGVAPFLPQQGVWIEQCTRTQRAYEDWMAYDLEWLKVCDVLLRIPGASSGADREVQWCQRNGVPVFFGIADLEQWLKAKQPVAVPA